jgi:hypothetical protein
MFQQDIYRKNVRASSSTDKTYLLATAERWLAAGERWLHFADQLDHLIRRWIIPVRYGVARPAAARPLPMVLPGALRIGSMLLRKVLRDFRRIMIPSA